MVTLINNHVSCNIFMLFRSNNNDDVQLIVGIEMEEDIKREAFVSTNENAASNEDDINTCYVQYKQGRHLVSVTIVTCNANFKPLTLTVELR